MSMEPHLHNEPSKLRRHIRREPLPRIEFGRLPQDVREVIIDVAQDYGVPVRNIRLKTKTPRIVEARHEAIKRISELKTPDGEPVFHDRMIGTFFATHRSSVIYAIKRAETRRCNDLDTVNRFYGRARS